MNMMDMLKAELYVFLPLSICMIMHLSMFYVLTIFLQHYMYVHVHGASFLDVWCMVASSSPVGGSGTLQCGIIAKVYSMGLNGL